MRRSGMDSRLLIGPGVPTSDPTARAPWNISSIGPHRLMEMSPVATPGPVVPNHVFPTVDVPDHAHYTIGVVILVVGITGILGNFLVIYAFCRSRSLRTPSNIFIINLAVTDFLMCFTQTPTFFITSMHKRWIFGKKGCEIYAFCGALFGICSMMTLMVIAVDRYVVITRPLASLGAMSRRKALGILAAAWVYSAGWSLPPFFGWSAYVPEGLMTSCSWDYMTFTPYADMLTPYMNSIPAVIAKASAIHNPIIYAITHPKYRSALGRYIPYLGAHFSDTEEDCSSRTPASRQLSSQRTKVRGNKGEFERTAAHNPADPAVCHLSKITTLTEPEGIMMEDITVSDVVSLKPSHLPATLDNVMEESRQRTTSLIVTSISSPCIMYSPKGFPGNQVAP
ncbi:Melanopsin-A [Liparis tanakae]|uniref:Melanopsin-A n=1 Tax=Liparis tanakae TaxID=230148 RepID=A0A4Z2HRF7_9TELE|nr:Melanopsin-A [Liparis tanakae]